MSQESSNNEGLLSLLAGVAVGALIGAGVALVTAPQSGEQTRTRLREGAEDTLTKLRESVDDLRVKLDELMHRRGGAAGEDLEPAGPSQV